MIPKRVTSNRGVTEKCLKSRLCEQRGNLTSSVFPLEVHLFKHEIALLAPGCVCAIAVCFLFDFHALNCKSNCILTTRSLSRPPECCRCYFFSDIYVAFADVISTDTGVSKDVKK